MYIIKYLLLFFAVTGSLLAQGVSEKIDDFIVKEAAYNQFTGSVLVADDGEVVFKKGYLLANREWNIPNTPDTKFRLGSITKQFTAAVILKLREEGKLKLDDKITDHIDYYRKDTGDKITIHQLLNHTSGIPSYTNNPDFFPDISIQQFGVDEFVKKYCMGDLEFEPGSQFSYNNSGYYLLGVIIEKITGKTYGEALHQYILDPLGMKDSGLDEFEKILNKRADGYSKLFIEYRNAPYLNMDLPYAAGQMYSTADDLFKWDRALYGAELLSQESLDLFFKPNVEAMGAHYAYGWFIRDVDYDNDGKTDTQISHGGGINGFNTLIARIPAKGQTVILLNNSGGAPLNFMAEQVFKMLDGQEYDYPKKGIGLAVYEKIEDENIDAAVDYYKELKEENQLDIFTNDRTELNRLGYYLMNNGNLDAALKILKLNMDEYPDWFNAYDSYAEVLMNDGQKEEAVKYYKKSLEMNPGNTNAVDKLKELGVEYKKEDVTVPAQILKKYEGEYSLQPGIKFTIRADGNQLFAQLTGQPEFEIYPQSETKFYYKVVEAQIEFNVNENGEVTGLILYQNGRKMPANKIK